MKWVGGRFTFLAAAIGVAISYESFNAFPTYMYEAGGFMFLFPYFLGLLIFGFPLLLLELTLGQMYQRSGVGVMRAVHPRLIGIGISKCFLAVVTASYYFWLCGSALFYLAESFRSPMKWSDESYTIKCAAGNPALEYYLNDFLGLLTDECTFKEPGDIADVNGWAFFGVIIAWA